MAQVSIPKRFFFEEAKKEYYNYSSRLFAEIFQNSRDAGASIIRVNFDDMGYSVSDNGSGMNKQTLLDGMLTLGGSVKKEGNTGAFGAAKKLVLYSHESYEIRTQNLLATGSGLEYNLDENHTFYAGTKISCKFFGDFGTPYDLKNAAEEVLSKCDFSESCRVFINGEEFTNWMIWPEATIMDTDWCVLKTKPGNGYVNIRKNGIFSFSRYVGGKKTAIIELKPPSIELFTQNRDSLRPPYSQKLDGICSEMSKGESTFGLPGIREFVYLGRNKFIEFVNKIKESSDEGSAAVFSLGNILAYESIEDRMGVVNALSAFHSSVDPKQLKEVNEEMCEEIQDSFVVDLADSPYTVPPLKYNPKTMGKKIFNLAKLWKETIKEILTLSGHNLDFQIGFTLDKECKALYSKKRNSEVVRLLINPENFDWKLDNQGKFWAVFISALEEVSHAITYQKDYESGHGETYNGRKNSIMQKVLPQIAWTKIWKQAQTSVL